MKKLCLAVAVLMLAVCSVTAVASASSTQYVTSQNGKNVYVRSAPAKGDNIVAELRFGTAVTVEYVYNKDWAVIKLPNSNDQVYIMRDFLSTEKPVKPDDKKKTAPKTTGKDEKADYSSFMFVESYEVTVSNSRKGAVAKLRWAPVKSAAMMSVLRSGEKVQVLAVSPEWYQVMDPGTGMVGFLNVAFIRE